MLVPHRIHGSIAAFVAGMALAMTIMPTGTALCGETMVVAHRGASYNAPENTLASVRLAWKLKSDAAEIDVYLTPDRRIVAIHDASTKRTTGVDLPVASTPSHELRALDAGSFKSPEYKGEKIPFLEEVIGTVPKGKRLVVEIKCGEEILPYLEKVVAKTKKRDRIVFIGFGWDVIRRCKDIMPDIPAYWLCTVDMSDSTAGPALKSGNVVMPLREALDAMKRAHLDGVDIGHNGMDAAMAAAARERGLGVLVWTVNDPSRARELAGMGVLGITTDRPDLIREALEK